MNKILPKYIFLFVLFFMATVFPYSKVYAAASVQFAPSTITAQQNATFEVKIAINVESNTALGSDAILNYNSTDLDVVSITNGGFFPEFGSASNTSGRIEIHGYTSSSNDSRTGNGTLATIILKAKKASGSSTISFTCTASGGDTNILTTSGQNILQCSQVNTVVISFSDTTVTNTNTPTPTTGSNNNNENTVPTCASLVSNITTATGTPQAVTFTCSGVDPNGYINAAEFIFGDGTSQVVEKNVGSPGSIATTHTYKTIGTLGASCRVRDNTNTYSSVSENCKKIITIKPATKKTTTPTIQTTPTLQESPIIYESPEPTLEPTLEITPTPEEYTEETTESGSSRIWWIVGGIIAILVALLLLKRRSPPAPPIQPMPPMNPPVDMNQPTPTL